VPVYNAICGNAPVPPVSMPLSKKSGKLKIAVMQAE
jgi:hypothetical protein